MTKFSGKRIGLTAFLLLALFGLPSCASLEFASQMDFPALSEGKEMAELQRLFDDNLKRLSISDQSLNNGMINVRIAQAVVGPRSTILYLRKVVAIGSGIHELNEKIRQNPQFEIRYGNCSGDTAYQDPYVFTHLEDGKPDYNAPVIWIWNDAPLGREITFELSQVVKRFNEAQTHPPASWASEEERFEERVKAADSERAQDKTDAVSSDRAD